MKVSVKDFAVSMEIKNKGIELDVYDNAGKHLGDLVVTKTKLVWCKGKTGVEAAQIVGKAVAERAIAKGITTVSFDRGGYLYHGRVKSLADAAREGGLKF